MEVKAPLPQVPPPGWSDVKDLQEWEKYHQSRSDNDKTSEALSAIADAGCKIAARAIRGPKSGRRLLRVQIFRIE